MRHIGFSFSKIVLISSLSGVSFWAGRRTCENRCSILENVIKTIK